MKKVVIITVFLLFPNFNHCLASQQEEHLQQEKKHAIRLGKQWGFFAEFLWVVNHLEWCIRNNLDPIVHWGPSSAYYSPEGYNGSKNVWEYYFEPVSSALWQKDDTTYLNLLYHPEFSAIWHYVQYIDHLWKIANNNNIKIIQIQGHDYSTQAFDRERPIVGSGYPISENHKHVYDPEFRQFVKNEIIDRFIHLKPSVQAKVDEFWEKNMKGKKNIGIHLRGKFLFNEVIEVPSSYILDHANEIGDPECQYFIATDQNPLLDHAIYQLKGKVISYSFQRGQITSSPLKPGQLTPEDGENVLIESLLLSKCDYFIHTLSQVSTAVLFFNPTLPHTLIY